MRLYRSLVIVCSVFALFAAVAARSASSDVVINEIMAYPAATADEWVELFNRGSAPVDLNGWVFYENATRHGIKTASSTTILLPGAYAIIAENSTTFAAKNPSVSALLFDSSWSSGLSAGGEQIGLKDASDAFLETFTYPASSRASLERIDAFAAPASANWLERPGGDSAGLANAASSGGSPVPPATTSTPVTPSAGTPTATLWAALRLNEIAPVPTGGSEWVELYNPSNESLDLNGGTLCDDRASSCVIANLSGAIAAHGFMSITISGSKLNNDGDSVILKSPAGETIDQVTYGGGTLSLSGGQVIARTVDGAGIWAVSTVSTMGAANVISAPPVADPVNSIIPGSSDETALDEPLISPNGSKGIVWYVTSTSPLRLTELFPNPDGDDTRDEFIELFNQTIETVALAGWKLAIDGNVYALSGSLDGGESMIVSRGTSHLELKNTTSSIVRLLNPDLGIASEATYPAPAQNAISYTEISPGQWRWLKPTPRALTATSASGIAWQLAVPRSVRTREMVTLSLGATADPRGGAWSALWSIDGQKKSGTAVTVSFVTSGVHLLTVDVTSTVGTVGRATANILATDDGVSSAGNVRLSELFPNPADPDTEEFIEIVNDDARSVRLDGWRLAVKSGKIFTIPDDTVLAPGGILVFYGAVTKLALAGSAETVRLIDSAGQIADRRTIPKIAEDASYQRIDGLWKVFPARSPGQLLSFPDGTGGGEEIPLSPVKKTTVKKTPAKKTTAKKVPAKKPAAFSVVYPAAVHALAKGARVQTEGIIVAPPGLFGAQYAAIATDDGGVLVYQNQKKFPVLDYGDKVRVRGTVSETSGRKRINVASEKDFDILSTDNVLDTAEIAISDLSEEDLGKLVTVSGELTSKKTTSGFIDDGTDELPFAIKTATKISTKDWKVGQRFAMTGVLVASAKGLELWPRQAGDVVFETATTSNAGASSTEEAVKESAAENKGLPVYPVIVGGLVLTNAGLLWQMYRAKKAAH